MRKLLFLFFGLFAFQSLSAQVGVRLALQPDNKTYIVYVRPDVNYAGPAGTTISAQLSMRVPSGGFNTGNMMSINGMWNRTVHVVAPEENNGFDYFSFSLVSATPAITYTAGEEVPIFSFENIGTCTGVLEFISNVDDPFLPPNSQNVNVGNAISVAGAGLGVNTYAGPYTVNGYTCLDNAGCGITFNGVELTSPSTCGASDGIIEIFASTDLGLDLVYSIDDGDTWQDSPIFAGLNSGDFNIWIRDVASICLEQVGLTNLPGPLGPTILLQESTSPDCDASNGTVTVEARAESGDPIEFSIDLGMTWQNSGEFTGLPEGDYFIQVRNVVNLCITQLGPFELSGCTPSNCIMFYEIEQLQSGRYQVSLLPTVTYPSPTNITSNLQVTIKAPTGGLVIEDLQSEVPNVSFSANSPFVSPMEAPDQDYFTISLATFPTSDINYIDGTRIPLFTFNNAGDCGGGGEIALIENDADPFFPPNSQNANVGQQLFVFAFGDDVPICLNENDSAPCVDVPPPPPVVLPTDTVFVTIPTDQNSTECLTAVIDVPNGLGNTFVCGNGNFVNANVTNGSDCVEIAPQSDFRQTDILCVVHCDNVDTDICDTTYIVICPQVQVQPVTAACAGSSFELTTIGGAGNLSWSTGDVGTTITVTPSATTTYTVTADNGIGCSTTDQVEVTVLPNPSSNFSFSGICFGDATAFTPSVSGLASYSWDFGDTNTSILENPSNSYALEGDYTVQLTVTDANGCTSSSSLPITIGGAGSGSGTRTSVSSCGGQDVQLSASAGTTYAWSPTTGLSDPTIANPIATVDVSTTYIVTIGGSSGCGMVDTVDVVITPAPVIIEVLGEDLTDCDNDNGSIKITATDAGNALEYSIDCGVTWSSDPFFTDLGLGTYGIVVRSLETGCSTKWPNDVIFTGPMTPMITNVITSNPSACGVNDASIILETTDSNVEYSIDGGTTWSSDSIFTDLSGGDYDVNIRFLGEMCTGTFGTGTVNLQDNGAPTVLNPIGEAFSCDGNETTIVIEISEDILSYNINTAGTFSADGVNGSVLIFDALPNADTTDFEVIIESGSGCTVTESFRLIASDSPELTISEKTDTDCNVANGAFFLNINGGVAPYTYSLASVDSLIQEDVVISSNSISFTDLVAGIYTITLNDQSSCSSNVDVEIESAESDFGLSQNIIMPDCGAANGSIEIANAPANASFLWTDVNGETIATTNVISDLIAGVYFINVTDEDTGCSQIEEINLTSAGTPDVLLGEVTEPLCAGDSSGVVSLLVNGEGEYQVAIPTLGIVQTVSGNDLAMFSGIPAGEYEIIIQNVLGCETTTTVILTEQQLQFGLNASQPTDCSLADGQICFTLSNGAAPFALQSSLGNMGNIAEGEQVCFSDIASGIYEIAILDANGCLNTQSISLEAVNQPSVEATDFEIAGFECPDDFANGLIMSNLANEFDVYDLNNNLIGTTPINNLAQGSYLISVDKGGCAAQTTVELTSSVSDWDVTTTVLNESCIENDGLIQLSVQGANGDYVYDWSGVQSSTNTANNLSADSIYAVTIQDIEGCEFTLENLTIETDCMDEGYPDTARLQTSINVPLTNICVLNDVPIPADMSLSICGEATNGRVDLVAGSCFEYTPNQDFSGEDEFCIEICDNANDCHQITILMTVGGSELEIMNGISPNGDGDGDHLIIRNIELYPENTVRIYNRWGNIVFKKQSYTNDLPWRGEFDGSTLPDGTYYIIIDLGTGERIANFVQVLR